MKNSLLRKVSSHLQEDMKTFDKEKLDDKRLLKKLSTYKEEKTVKQSAKDKKDESLGERRGKESSKKQTMKDRRHESEGSSKHHHKMAKHHHSEMKKHIDHLHEMAKKKESSHEKKEHEAAAGRKYNRSAKHHEAESRGMKKAMRYR